MSVASMTDPRRAEGTRWLLLGSLALNLFFLGTVVAMIVRQPPAIDRSISTRIERLAATLPSNDAAILRRNYDANRTAVDGARASYEASRDSVRAALRREPFDAAAMRDAMTQTRGARQNFDQLLQAVVVTSASEMSQAGRSRLADYGPASQQNNR